MDRSYQAIAPIAGQTLSNHVALASKYQTNLVPFPDTPQQPPRRSQAGIRLVDLHPFIRV